MAHIKSKTDLRQTVERIVARQPVTDIHTHIYDTHFGDLLLWGVDELLTYHYLVAEVMRFADIPVEKFWRLGKKKQAELIWEKVFVENSPLSEASRGVLTCLDRFGANLRSRNLDKVRDHFGKRKVEDHIDAVFELANVESVVMTNDPFDDRERPVWEKGVRLDPRFRPALRIDTLLVDWPRACKALRSWGYKVQPSLTRPVMGELRRFLDEWIERMKPVYLAASLPPTFAYPEDSDCGRILAEALLETARERGVPFAMMIGVKKRIHPELGDAGDGVGKSDVGAVERLCADFPDNRFLVTLLARENQHELCVAARKFRNLMPFGCWWFLNNPSLIREMTAMRLELLGPSFIPQHSDARVLDQLIYKWTHSRELIADALVGKYANALERGWPLTRQDIKRDVANLFGGNFERFVKS